MDPKTVLEQLRTYFLDSGFNLTLAINSAKYNAANGGAKNLESIFPQAKSIILVGFAGKEFWSIFLDYLQNNPEFKKNNIDLIDNYSVLKFVEASEILNTNQIDFKTVYPFGDNALDLNFLKLGELAGAGVPSLLGILLHPVYGPWISLRGAFITNMELSEYDEPLSDFSPCPSCDKPCISACPINTISELGWDWESCMKFRINDETCSSLCASRRACPYGQEEQYTLEQLHYHHKFVLKSVKQYFKENPKS
jgi:epoxyqueuosine reductase QueG